MNTYSVRHTVISECVVEVESENPETAKAVVLDWIDSGGDITGFKNIVPLSEESILDLYGHE